MEYGQALETETKTNSIKLNYEGRSYDLELSFTPYQSLMYKIEKNNLEQLDIEFFPSNPVVLKRQIGYEAPWLVK